MPEQIVKIAFRVERDVSRHIKGEHLWAERVGTDRFRLANTPFYVRGVSFGDVVFARRGRDGCLRFAGVSLHGGHSTCWVALEMDVGSASFRRAWAGVAELGCRYEGDGGRFLAVDVPPGADLLRVRRLLEAGAAEGAWEFEVAHCGHLAVAREPVAVWSVQIRTRLAPYRKAVATPTNAPSST